MKIKLKINLLLTIVVFLLAAILTNNNTAADIYDNIFNNGSAKKMSFQDAEEFYTQSSNANIQVIKSPSSVSEWPDAASQYDVFLEVAVNHTSDSTTPMFVRVMVLPTLYDKAAFNLNTVTTGDGINHLNNLNQSTSFGMSAFSKNLNYGDWIDGNDGYYYYNKKLSSGRTSPVFASNHLTITKSVLDAQVVSFDKQGGTNVGITFSIKAESIIAVKNVDGSAQAYKDAWFPNLSDAQCNLNEACKTYLTILN